jgi:hypothetical protein
MIGLLLIVNILPFSFCTPSLGSPFFMAWLRVWWFESIKSFGAGINPSSPERNDEEVSGRGGLMSFFSHSFPESSSLLQHICGYDRLK